MLARACCMLLLLGGQFTVAAEPGADEAPVADETPGADEAPAASEDSDAEAAVSLDGESFVPSVQISEDLSVSFPTDI